VNLWRSRTADTPRIRRVRGHRTPEYHRAPRQHAERHRDYNLCLHRPSSSGVVPNAMGYHMDSRCVLRGNHLWSIWTQRFAPTAACGRESEPKTTATDTKRVLQ